MRVKFYGTRGSIPVAEREFIQVGGNTSCVLVTFENGRIAILDSGTGIRKLGNDIEKGMVEQFDNIFIALSHTHLDHIHGFPFFKPAYDPRLHFTISLCGVGRENKDLEMIFSSQMRRDYFPVPMDMMGGAFKFWEPMEDTFHAPDGIAVKASRVVHTAVTYGYRIEENGRILTYCTDVEHKDGIDPAVISLAKNADLLIHDAQYTPEELSGKKGWGHSSWEQAAAVAIKAGVKRLALFHHDPEHSDTQLFEIEKEAQKVFPGSFLAMEGKVVEF